MKALHPLPTFPTPSLFLHSSNHKLLPLSFSSLSPPPLPTTTTTTTPTTTHTNTTTEPKKTTTTTTNLTHHHLTNINLLLPRLCLSNHLPNAIRLVDAALLANPPPKSLSLSILIHSLTSQPTMTLPMSLLTRLRHNPHAHSSLLSITTMLISSYFKMGKPKEALKVYNWMCRPGSVCEPDVRVYGVLVCGFCRGGLVFEALRVLRGMVAGDLVPGRGLRKWVYRGLLREARIGEARELEGVLGSVGVGGSGGLGEVVEVLDRVIDNWED